MKRSIFIVFLGFISCLGHSQIQQSISIPIVAPSHCTRANGQLQDSGECKVIMYPGTTAIIVAKESGSGTITDSLGSIWLRDFCNPQDNGECIFHAQLNAPYPIGDVFTFPSGGYADVYIFQYQGIWNFLIGQSGSYSSGNAGGNTPFPDCPGGNCPYNWTLPVEADAGNLLIAYSFPQSSGPGIPKPGLGYSIEVNDGFLAIEDMIAPIGGVYIGSLTWTNLNSHWLMGIGVYAKQ